MPELDGRESRKKSGPAREAIDHCFGVHEERGFLLCVPTDGRAPPKRAPEMSASCGYHLGPQRREQTATIAIAATKNPVCKRRSLPTAPWEPVQHAIARVPRSRANFPGRTHGVPQAAAMSHQSLLLQARPPFQL